MTAIKVGVTVDSGEEELKTSDVIADGGSLKSTTRAAIDYEHATVALIISRI